jgi:hypothetical protein
MHPALEGRAPETVGSTDRNAKSPAIAGKGIYAATTAVKGTVTHALTAMSVVLLQTRVKDT